MHSLIADIAIASVPDPVPVVGELIFAVRLPLRRSEEEVPIETGRHGLIRGMADREAAPETERPRLISLTDRALIDELNGVHFVGQGTALGAYLNHAVVLPGRGHHLLALVNIVAGGLLHLDGFSRLGG